MESFFASFATQAARVMGSAWSFVIAALVILVWAVSGPMFHFSEVWQLVINTSTTIVTFLMVFLIQNTQNRESRAVHLKLDELLLSIKEASNDMIDIEELSSGELEVIAARIKDAKARGGKVTVADVGAVAAQVRPDGRRMKRRSVAKKDETPGSH